MQRQKSEGVAFPPVFVSSNRLAKTGGGAARLEPPAGTPCEMCGARLVAAHCKSICLRCGFLAGCGGGL
jgi:hypothetical protein